MASMRGSLALALVALVASAMTSRATAACPFAYQGRTGPAAAEAARRRDLLAAAGLLDLVSSPVKGAAGGDGGVPPGGYRTVMDDLKAIMQDTKDFWPADFAQVDAPGHYGGLFIRLAWHCSGSYRQSDGRGGCDGGRIRFSPERTWMDNGNLDKALELLEPIKDKYGSSLSWGDLVILAGNAAIESMGGPVLGFCGGRIDSPDGSESIFLGPSPEQEAIAPCAVNGACDGTLGPTTLGLIYVNPEGPMANPDPVASSSDVRSSFGRMGMNDTETVALVGGGHAFGKCHGACLKPPCGDGKGINTYTSGFEGSWSTQPTTWTNEYFQNLFNYNWSKVDGPGGHVQWAPEDGPNIIMLTADLALINDGSYRNTAELFSQDISELEKQFMHAWYKLTTADMGPATRCLGDLVPEPQPFQNTLPAPPATLPDYEEIENDIVALIESDPSNAAKFAHLAFSCASTYRATDHRGGCNGARIRFSPEKDWSYNRGAASVLAILQPIYEKYASMGLSWADLIVLAGVEANEYAGAGDLGFCGGRTDADDGAGSVGLAPRYYMPLNVSLNDDAQVKGLSAAEYVALMARLSDNSISSNNTAKDFISNEFFANLLNGTGTPTELALLDVPSFAEHVQHFAADEEGFMEVFRAAWTKLMNADRYEPGGNLCAESAEGPSTSIANADSGSVSMFTSSASLVALLFGSFGMMFMH